ncbi:MAG TPA: hydantoinase/carbamoylase family amidase, partial [Clostridia bacterium]|nr:hydantoinase/carbamoylase family amidase [Clostridia bacterium]
SALEALTCIKESGIRLKRPVEMVALIKEEATEFLGGLFGSKAICGMLPDNYADITRDKSTGRLLRDAMKEFGMGLDPDRIRASMRGREEFYRFFELHIEQAGLLEERDLPVGIVTTIAGIHQMKFELTGRSAHAGAMPMEQRKDAMAAAASIACEVERLAKNSGSETRATVGYISAYPGEHNIIAGNATIPVDIREKNPVVRKRIFDSLLQCVEQECRSRGVKSEIQLTLDSPPVNCDPCIVNLFENAAKQQGVPFMEIVSYAAHDAMNMATLCPMGMIFVRSKDGLSHCPEEFTSKEDLAAGANVLLNSMIQAASE